jgi:hypothetical protein
MIHALLALARQHHGAPSISLVGLPNPGAELFSTIARHSGRLGWFIGRLEAPTAGGRHAAGRLRPGPARWLRTPQKHYEPPKRGRYARPRWTKTDMVVTGTRRRGHNQRQQHQECHKPEHRPEHPFRGISDHGALTPEAIEIVGSLLKNARELHVFAAPGSETASPCEFGR